jgi:ubiquinone/menaquinone biosynthesis C-methylase UbiE
MSLWDVADYTRLRTGGDDPVLERFATLHSVAGARVLDLGCGPGRASAALADRHDAVVTGLDTSPEMLAAAQEIVPPSVELVEGRAEALPFADASFDFVLSNFVIHLLDRPLAFPEVRRVLAPGGAYWIKTQDPATLDDHWAAPLFPSLAAIERARFPGEAQLGKELATAGFTTVRFDRHTLERVFSREHAIQQLESGAYSTTRVLPPDELAEGIRRAPELLPDPVRSRS